MCSSQSTAVSLSSSQFGGNLSIARSRCSPLSLSAKQFISISLKSNILPTSDAQRHSQSSEQAMKGSFRQGFRHLDIVPARISPPRCAASNSKASEDAGFQWRKKSDFSELRNSSSPPASSAPRSKMMKDGVQSKSFSQEGSGGSGRKQDKGTSRANGPFKSRTFSTGRVASSSKSRSPSSDADEHDGKNFSTNGPLEGKRKKPPKIREQVRITSPTSKEPKVAILGGGMSGLMCALTLQEKGIHSTVFDTGKHGLGGRMGTRHIARVNGEQLVFDHAAQYFTATDPKFRKLVEKWVAEGVVKEWEGVIGTLEKGGEFTELQSPTKFVAINGMRLLADHLVSKRQLIDIIRPCWISRLNEFGGMWHLSEYEKDRGDFDVVVIAHNGKCANRLLLPIGVPLVAKQMKRLELSAIWALMAAFDEPLPAPISPNGNAQMEGAFVTGVDSLSWMANNTAKLQPSQKNGPHCWTFFSTAKYGKKNKVPQESIPSKRVERVTREMLQGIEEALGLDEGSLPTPLYTKVQLWGAANPVNTPHVPCIFDGYGRVGICGDWLLGSSLEAAALSGMAMGEHISEYIKRKGMAPEEFSVGLEEVLLPLDGHDIGQFAGQQDTAPALEMQLLSAV